MSVFGTLTGEHGRPLDRENEWDGVPHGEMNFFQQVAGRTNGWLTPGNLLSVGGAALTVSGLLNYNAGHRIKGVIKVFGGRLCDIGDGWAAKRTKTRSAKGAVLDAGFDKYSTVAATIALHNDGITPRESIGMTALQIDIVRSSIAIDAEGGRPDPNAIGKISMFATWCWIGSTMAQTASQEASAEKLNSVFTGLRRAFQPVAFGLTAHTSLDYHKRLSQAQKD